MNNKQYRKPIDVGGAFLDNFGRVWPYPKNELCAICGQPDSCGDCNHDRLSEREVDLILLGNDYNPSRQCSEFPASKAGPWSVVYEADGEIYGIGPLDTKKEAEQAAKNAQTLGEYDISDQHVYLIGPDHCLVELSEEDVKSDE